MLVFTQLDLLIRFLENRSSKGFIKEFNVYKVSEGILTPSPIPLPIAPVLGPRFTVEARLDDVKMDSKYNHTT